MEQAQPTKEYFARRAGEEHQAAMEAADERAAQSHRELAERYDQLARGEPGAEVPPDEPPGGLSPEFRILP